MCQIVTWCDTRDMVPFIQTEIPKRFALRIRLIETLEGWQERSQTRMALGLDGFTKQCLAQQHSSVHGKGNWLRRPCRVPCGRFPGMRLPSRPRKARFVVNSSAFFLFGIESLKTGSMFGKHFGRAPESASRWREAFWTRS